LENEGLALLSLCSPSGTTQTDRPRPNTSAQTIKWVKVFPMGRPNGLRGADRRIPNPFEGVKCDRADNDHGGWLSAHVRA
jgi:hypothetical protein